MDFSQVYQIVYVLLRMGDSPRPANWILERSLDGQNYKPWVFFAESEYECRRLYQPLINEPLTVTSGPRPWMLQDDEVYCTTFYSQPQSLQSGEIIVTLSLDRASTISGPSGIERAISPKLIDFLSARYVRLRFQKLQTLSGDWMAMPNQLDSSVYNRYYYSIRTIKVGGKCLCNSHANRCEQRVVDGVPRAVCICQHNTCGSNCEVCCPMFNQQLWRPGGVCEECNCHGKADSCVFNQTVANLRLSKRKDGQYTGGGVCVNCREDTTGVNCESCKPGYYRPLNVRPEAAHPCVKCSCDSYGSTGECISSDARIPDLYPGDCICKEGFSGKRCDQCAEGYRRSEADPSKCVPCTCDIRGSRRGGGYKCEPPCNCKINVDPGSYCKACQPGHFNLDSENPEGCQACYCSGLTSQCDSVSVTTASMLDRTGLLGTISTLANWKIIVPSASAESGFPVPYHGLGITGEELPLRVDIRTIESWLTSATLQPTDRGYYWSAPTEYLKKQITAHLGDLFVIVSFNSPTVTRLVGMMTSESAQLRVSSSLAVRDQLEYMWLNEPDIVLEGNGFRLVHVIHPTQRDSHMIIQLHLNESSFRVLVEPPSSVPVDKIPISLSQGTIDKSKPYEDGPRGYEQAGRPATVADVIAVLSRLDRLLIKVKHISDQTTAELRLVKLESVKRDDAGRIPKMEECVCPTGHTGTSCESCAYGYWRDPNKKLSDEVLKKMRGMWRQIGPSMQHMCVPCDCNGHSGQCDEQTGKCIDCQHNTAGDRCNECAPGFYGDPTTGNPNACQPCECPILANQRTVTCIANEQALSTDAKPYICLDCDGNTRGRYCELCAPGYYGQPDRGISCKKCDCGRGAIGCNETTGACICGFNTAGPRCDVCAEGTHGDPLMGQPCRPCNCHEKGSVSSTCRPGDGQCNCRPGYEGVRCERCTSGRGNVDAGCPPCQCSAIGTLPDTKPQCDPVTGQCNCKPGVGGTLDCSKCLPGYYNLGPHGCQVCQCTNRAIDLVCDPDTGQCNCGDNVIGETCDKCRSGHYWNVTGPNCLPCDCGIGTKPSAALGFVADCNMQTGQCTCAPNVTGRRCTECEPGYFGVTSKGCQPCPTCPNGQVCDQITGKCICPPNTQGDQCEECTPGSWDYNPVLGCKSCNCSTTGSEPETTDTCDLKTGQCTCRLGFAARDCAKCAPGHYGYPKCDPCECDARGTVRENRTITSSTTCNQTDGSCICKDNVQGQRCDECKPGTFGLSIDYSLGCYSCFCFPTSSVAKCSLLLGYRSVPGKERGVEVIATDSESSPGGPLIQLDVGFGHEASTDLSFGISQFNWRFSAHRPTYLEIPELKGSITRNYGSVLIAVSSECLPTGDCSLAASDSVYTSDLIVASTASTDEAGSLIVRRPYRIDAKMIALGGQLHLEYQPADDVEITKVDGFRQIWLREADWVLTRVVGVDTRVRPTRNELMLALLNVTSFSVRLFMPEANPKLVSVKYRVYEALSETATAAGTQIRSIEKCDCPSTSSGDHCEVAAPGFYFPTIVPKPGPSIKPSDPGGLPPSAPENIIWIGGVEKCRCHGMSSHCNPVTGVCESCTGNTMGPDCGECAVGYTGDPKKGQPCVKCQCPSEQTDYALTCYPVIDRPYTPHHCVCKPGYTGVRCERCAPGYFGDPLSMIACQPCDCDRSGSKSENCAMDTGQCDCWPGVSGRRCDQCEPDQVVDAGRCIDCRGDCTGELLVKADEVKGKIDSLNMTSLAHQGLARLGNQAEALRKRFSKDQAQREDDLIRQVQHVAKQLEELRNKSKTAKNAKEAAEKMRCETQANINKLSSAAQQLDKRIGDWIKRVSELPKVIPDPQQIQRWLEDARRVRVELSTINLNDTQEWIDQTKREMEKLIGTVEQFTNSVKPGRSVIDLERIASYQKQQEELLELQTNQIYSIGNSTTKASEELTAAQAKGEALRKAATEAMNMTIMEMFDNSIEKLRDELTNASGVSTEVLEAQLDEAKNALKRLATIDLSDLDRIYIPPTLEKEFVIPREYESDSIIRMLTFSSDLNRTMDAMNAYQTIIDNMNKAKEATLMAENALAESMAGDEQSWQEMLEHVAKQGVDLEETLESHADELQRYNEKLNEVLEPLAKAESDLDEIEKTADRTLSTSQDVTNKVSKVMQLLADTKPQVLNVSAMTKAQDESVREIRDRLHTVETRYARLQGTAQSTVDQANSTQLEFVKLIGETESITKQLDTKLLRLRRLAAEARSLLDVTYGSLAKDPVPLQIEPKCVYTLVPYSISKSRVFDIEFWFRLHAMPPRAGSVLMVGRRAFTGRTQMFSFTIEDTGTKLRFSWNVANGVLELDSIATGVWYQVRVVSLWGETRMMLLERPDEDNANPVYREVTSQAGVGYPEATLMLDRQMEIRVGGAIHQGARLMNPEAWGDNGAETLWARLMAMESAEFCIFNLRISGIHMGLMNLAALPDCGAPKKMGCQLRHSYRSLARDGYIWRPQNNLHNVSTVERVAQSMHPNHLLQRLFYYDFAGTGGYARLEQFKDLRFCEDRVQFQLSPVEDAQRSPMMVFTFYNFDKDMGITLELIKGIPRATGWTGGHLYRSLEETSVLDAGTAFRLRVLRAARARRTLTSGSDREKWEVPVTQSDLTIRLWRLDKLLTEDCADKTIMFVGAIPPGHYSIRRRMHKLGLTLNPFVGRIGLTNEKPSQVGGLFLEEYVNEPVSRLGDSQYTDLLQQGEAFVPPSMKPDLQYCLRLNPEHSQTNSEFGELKLDESRLGSPWEPGISMTVRFNPLATQSSDVVLLRLQMNSAKWLTVWLTNDYRIGLVIPDAGAELFTQESLVDKPLSDPATALHQLELAEARMVNASLPAWSDQPEDFERTEEWNKFSDTGEIEVAITLHFSGADSKRIDVLFDHRLVQSWTIPIQDPMDPINQALVGPYTKFIHPITISYLLIGKHLVDFAKELSISEKRSGVRIGSCGGQLHPRFFARNGFDEPVLAPQGLDLDPPPGGRRLRFSDSGAIYDRLTDRSQVPTQPLRQRLRREEDCAINPNETAWFDKTPGSFWELNDLGARIGSTDGPFEFSIGFRAQLSPGIGASAVRGSIQPKASVQYSLLAAFNFGLEKGNLYLILSHSQIFVTNANHVLWSSQHVTISDSSWHHLTLRVPHDTVQTETSDFSMESGVYMIFDGRHMWLPQITSGNLPILALIGGLPSASRFALDPNENVAPIVNLFGCIDEVVINGIHFDPKQSGRPACYDCFSLDPNIVHVTDSIHSYLRTSLIPMEIPPMYLQTTMENLTFDFSFFYDHEKTTSASLFVLVFEGTDTMETKRVWIYVLNSEVKMVFVEANGQIGDYGHSVRLLQLPLHQNTWNYIEFEVISTGNLLVLTLRSQVERSLSHVIMLNFSRLKAIYFGLDEVVTPELMYKAIGTTAGRPFTGCLRGMQLRMGTSSTNVKFPVEVPNLLKGVCHTSRVW